MRTTTTLLLAATGLLVLALPLAADEPAPPPPRAQPVTPPVTPPMPTPKPAPTAEQVQALVRQLGQADFATRERAGRELLAIGEPARGALETAMRQSENMEVRWRAEQILRRLDRERARPMSPERAEPEARRPRGADGQLPMPGWEDLEQRLERLRRRLDEPWSGFGPFTDQRKTLEAPGLALEVATFGSMLARIQLRVEGHARPYSGNSLEEILLFNPELDKLPGMPQLKQKWAEYRKANPELFRFADLLRGGLSQGFSMTQSGQGVEITQDGDTVRVKITDTDGNGDQVTREFEGKSLEEIKRKHPEVSERLGAITFSFRMGPPQIFRRGSQQPRVPFPPRAPTPVTPGDRRPDPRGPFGVAIDIPELVLAAHLGLPAGHGALVVDVTAGSQASEIGLTRFDVIVSVNGTPVQGVKLLAATLARAAAGKLPLTLEVIRAGRRLTLSR